MLGPPLNIIFSLLIQQRRSERIFEKLFKLEITPASNLALDGTYVKHRKYESSLRYNIVSNMNFKTV